MIRLVCTVAFLAVAMVASANKLTLNFKPQADDGSLVDVYAVVTGDNQGLLNYDLSVRGITDIEGLTSDAITFRPARMRNLDVLFRPTGFPLANCLKPPLSPEAWTEGASQFGAAHPLVGLGRVDVFVAGAIEVPDNPDINIPFVEEEIPQGGPFGSYLGTIDLGVELDIRTLEGALGGGGSVFGTAGAGVPIGLDGPATINVIGIPEPSTCILAGLALTGLAAWGRVKNR